MHHFLVILWFVGYLMVCDTMYTQKTWLVTHLFSDLEFVSCSEMRLKESKFIIPVTPLQKQEQIWGISSWCCLWDCYRGQRDEYPKIIIPSNNPTSNTFNTTWSLSFQIRLVSDIANGKENFNTATCEGWHSDEYTYPFILHGVPRQNHIDYLYVCSFVISKKWIKYCFLIKIILAITFIFGYNLLGLSLHVGNTKFFSTDGFANSFRDNNYFFTSWMYL